jgi:hypothetical protein
MPAHMLSDRNIVTKTGNEDRDDRAIYEQIQRSRQRLKDVAGGLVRNVEFQHEVQLVSDAHYYVIVRMRYDGLKSPEVMRIEHSELTPAERRVQALKKLTGMVH